MRPGIITAMVVSVGLCAAFAGGMAYTMMRKEISIVSAGRARSHTTFKRTVGDVLREAGVTLSPGEEISPGVHAWVTEGLTIAVRPAVPVTITVDGRTIQAESAAASVVELLARRGVTLSSWDKVFPARDAPLAAGMHVRVLRVQRKLVTEQMAIPYQVRSTVDPRTPRGILRVLSPGRLGLRERVWQVTLADGQVVERTLLGWRVLRSPVDRVVTLGTQTLVASRGQFADKESLDLIATAYSPFCCKGVDDITALGVRAGYGVVAVDPKVIPLGSRLYIEGYGYALAADTGSQIKGMRIDLGFDTKREAIRFGRRPVRVYIIEKKPRHN